MCISAMNPAPSNKTFVLLINVANSQAHLSIFHQNCNTELKFSLFLI